MCRNIRTLFNFEPPATEDEIRASALQFVRKLSGFSKPSQANAEAFDRAVEEVSATARRLLKSLETASPPRDREVEAEKARARARERYASPGEESATGRQVRDCAAGRAHSVAATGASPRAVPLRGRSLSFRFRLLPSFQI
jgi:hypothetical protein